MSESTWLKWCIVSVLLHLAAFIVFSVQLPKSTRKINFSSYSVSLVGDMGGGPKTTGETGAAKGAPVPLREPAKPEKKAEAKKPAKEKLVKPKPVRPEKNEVSISKKKAPLKEPPKQVKKEKATASKDDLKDLKERLDQIKKRTSYVDISRGDGAGSRGAGTPGLPFSGEGTGRPLDLATQKYYMDIRDKITAAWRMPGSGLKKLVTEVTITIRKDGKLVEWNVDKGSGSRVFDESVTRALRAAEPYPPIPPSLSLDSIEIPFRFRPEDMS